MKRMIIATAIAVALGLGQAQSAQNKEQLENQIDAINASAKKGDLMNVALHTTSVETGVPRDQVDALHKKHPETGAASIFIACVLAAETKKDPETFIKQHQSKGWAAIAKENNVPLEKITERTARLEQALKTGKPQKEKAQKEKKRNG